MWAKVWEMPFKSPADPGAHVQGKARPFEFVDEQPFAVNQTSPIPLASSNGLGMGVCLDWLDSLGLRKPLPKWACGKCVSD